MTTQTKKKSNHSSQIDYNRLLCVNTNSVKMTYASLKADIIKSLGEVQMDILYVGSYRCATTNAMVICIAFNDDFVPEIIKQLVGKNSWFKSMYVSPKDYDIEEFCWQYYVVYDPEMLAISPAVRSSKSDIRITTGRLIRHDDTEEASSRKLKKKGAVNKVEKIPLKINS